MSNKEDYNDGNEYKFDNIEVDKDTHKKVKKKGGAGVKIYSVLITLLAGALAGSDRHLSRMAAKLRTAP